MRPGAPVSCTRTSPRRTGWVSRPRRAATSRGTLSRSLGDAEAAFAQADVVVEREFRTKMVHQGYIEPQTCTALWGEDGRLTIWNSSQGQFGMRDQICRVLDVPVSEVKVVPLEIGGGFGGKLRAYLEPVAALLSKKSGHPVKITMSRADVLEATGPDIRELHQDQVGRDEGRQAHRGQGAHRVRVGGVPRLVAQRGGDLHVLALTRSTTSTSTATTWWTTCRARRRTARRERPWARSRASRSSTR